MTLLETLALLTLLATVGFGMFDIAWKTFNNKIFFLEQHLFQYIYDIHLK